MAKVLQCRDLGFDCEHVVRGEDEQEVLQKAVEHAREVHGLNDIPPEVVEQAKGAMRDE